MFCTCSRNCSIVAFSFSPVAVSATRGRLAAQRVGLAVELLHQEIEPPADCDGLGQQGCARPRCGWPADRVPRARPSARRAARPPARCVPRAGTGFRAAALAGSPSRARAAPRAGRRPPSAACGGAAAISSSSPLSVTRSRAPSAWRASTRAASAAAKPARTAAVAGFGPFLLRFGAGAQHAGQRQQRLGPRRRRCRGCARAAPSPAPAPVPAPPDRAPVSFSPRASSFRLAVTLPRFSALPAASRSAGSSASQPGGRRKRRSSPRPLTLRSSQAQARPPGVVDTALGAGESGHGGERGGHQCIPWASLAPDVLTAHHTAAKLRYPGGMTSAVHPPTDDASTAGAGMPLAPGSRVLIIHALITGASSGIGRALAEALARPGRHAASVRPRYGAAGGGRAGLPRTRGRGAHGVLDVRDAAAMADWIARRGAARSGGGECRHVGRVGR